MITNTEKLANMLHAIINDPTVCKYLTKNKPETLQAAREALKEYEYR